MAQTFAALPTWRTLAQASTATFTLNETGDRCEFFFIAGQAGTIADVFVNFGAATGSPSVRISLQSAAADGRANGILAGGGAYVDASPATGSAVWRTLGATYTAARGEKLVLTVQLLTGTSILVNYRIGGTEFLDEYCTTYDNATTTATKQAGPTVWGIRGNGFIQGNPIKTNTTTLFSTSSSPSEIGTLFTLPDWSDSITISGLETVARLNTSATLTANYYAGNSATATTPATASDALTAAIVRSSGGYGILRLPFATPQTLTAGASCRLSITPGNTNQIGAPYYEYDAAADLAAINGWGTAAQWTERAGGNWTDRPTRLAPLAPLITDATKGQAAAAGLLFRRSLRLP